MVKVKPSLLKRLKSFGMDVLSGKLSKWGFLKLFLVTTIFVVAIHLYKNPPCILGVMPLRSYTKLGEDARFPPNITVVSAYFDIGDFHKGANGNVFGPKLYHDWATVFEYLENPLILFTDSDVFVELFKSMRWNRLNRTKIIKVNKQDLWAFDYLAKIRDIYSDPNYPKYRPNTVVAEYPCIQNAKYSVMEKAIESDTFNTQYYMWLDVGYFRMLTKRKHTFRLVLPPGFDDSKIAFNQVNVGYTLEETPIDIFRQMLVWVGGGLSLARKDVFKTFIKEYRRALDRYTDMRLSNSDQQILFAMNTKSERRVLNLSVEVQLYKWHLWGSCWYFLGYQCYREL